MVAPKIKAILSPCAFTALTSPFLSETNSKNIKPNFEYISISTGLTRGVLPGFPFIPFKLKTFKENPPDTCFFSIVFKIDLEVSSVAFPLAY